MAIAPDSMDAFLAHLDDTERRWKRGAAQRDEAQVELEKMRRGEVTEWRRLDQPSRVRERLERLGLRAEASALLDAPSQSFNPAERIIAENQLAGVEFFERGLVAARAVARIEIRGPGGTPSGYGTGVMISPHLLLTNNHVLADGLTAAASFAQFEYVRSVSGPRDALPFAFRPELFFETDEALDYTVVAVEPVNAVGLSVTTRGWCPLSRESGKAIIGERVNIVQHPSGERMQIAVRENTIVGVVDAFLHYQTDTRPGSSGSPVFNDQWEMAALHHAGVPRRDGQGRILLVDGRRYDRASWDGTPVDFVANEGVRISRIVEHVERRGLDRERDALWRRAFEPSEPLDIWDLFNRPAHPPTGGGAASPFEAESSTDGNASWLFRLSFGPAGEDGGAILPARAGEGSPAPSSGSPMPTPRSPSTPAPTDPATRARSGSDIESIARALLERHRDDEPWLDEDAAKARAEAYWCGFDLQSDSAELFTALAARLATTHRPISSYQHARLVHLYPSVDVHEDGALRNLYSGTVLDPLEAIASELAAFERSAARPRIPTLEEELLERDVEWSALENAARLAFNCEHVVCQSWFDKREPMRSDLHHLFACEPRCNSFRSNIPYWQFDPEEEAVMSDCGRTAGRTKFEPNTGKGPASRATMYFLMRYPGEIGDRRGEMTKSRIGVLRQWHTADPPGPYERHRNDRIERAQGNRNPFIDYPQIATIALLERGFGVAESR